MTVLISRTIIPESLYVERAADRQLHKAVLGMGRPPYILVARQMGKTNLLIQTSNQLQGPQRRFVYLDLSSRHPTVGDYYIALIDRISELHPDVLPNTDADQAISEIKNGLTEAIRSQQIFDRLLRAALRRFSGEIVVVLDEIDALAGSTFSDNVFSHIRSTYFARGQFPELNKITYVLSGVARPTDLIKNKEVSPFNIGENILLGDFSYQEHLTFILKAKLSLSEQTAERIFWWAAGNPRITWDICAEIEQEIENGQEASVTIVDTIVDRLYFHRFDKAPVNDTRQLITNDADLRDAFTNLRWGKPELLSDEARVKLYLAGIIATPEPNESRIKNRILDKSLSDEWLASLEQDFEQVLYRARANMTRKEYSQAIANFEAYLARKNPDSLSGLDCFSLGLGYLSTDRAPLAIEWLSKAENRLNEKKVALRATYQKARALQTSGRLTEAVQCYREVCAHEDADDWRFAAARLALLLTSIGGEAGEKEARVLADSVLGPANRRAEDLRQNESTSLSYLARALLHWKSKDTEPAKEDFTSSIETAPDHLMWLVALRILESGTNLLERADLVEDIISGLEKAHSSEFEKTSLDEKSLSGVIAAGWIVQGPDSLSRIMSVPEVSRRAALKKPGQLLYDAWDHAAELAIYKDTDQLLRASIKASTDVAPDIMWRAYRSLIVHGTANRNEMRVYLEKYISPTYGELVDTDDYYAAFTILRGAIEGNDKELEQLIRRVLPQLQSPKNADLRFGYAIILFYEMMLCRRENRGSEAYSHALALKELLREAEEEETKMFDASIFKDIATSAEDVIARHAPRQTYVNPYRGIARNKPVIVRYSDGRLVTAKFKNVQKDLVLQRCSLVETEESDIGEKSPTE